jgi:ABC-type multidrug transport system permease subunit
LQALSNAIPITYGLQALREVAVGGGLEQIYPSIGAMLLIGAALYGLAYLAFKRFERMARITGSMDLF